jgi:hypothetical protein
MRDEDIDTMSSMPPLCRGSIVLGTGCKRCARCVQALNELGDPDNGNTARIIREVETSFRRLFAWIKLGFIMDPRPDSEPSHWTRAGFSAQHMTQTPAGEFYHITKPDTGFNVFLRPDAPACLGWLKRIDLRGETTLHSLTIAARVEFGPPEDPMADPLINLNADCNRSRMSAGLPYPRTCARCGLGPCPGPARLPAVVIRPDDPLLVAVKAEFLHGMPDLTGRQINELAMMAVAVVKRVANRE